MSRTLAPFVAPGIAAALLFAFAACQSATATTQGAAPQAAPASADSQQLAATPQIERAASDAKHWIALGDKYFDSHQRQNAIEAYAKALELDPNNPDVLTDQGVMYSETTQYEKAIANFQRAHAIDPTHLPSLLNLGMLYAQSLKEHEKAIATWTRVIEIAPTTVQAAKAHAYIERVKQASRPQ